MHGRLFTLLDTPFPSYFILILMGILLAATIAALSAKRIGQDPDVLVDLGLVALIAGFAGARVLHIFADGHLMDYVHACTAPELVDWHITKAECVSESYRGRWDLAKGVCHPVESNCWAWAQFWNGGYTFYGGFIGATAAALWLFKRDRFPVWKAVDLGGMTVPIGLGFGRLGCLLAGCCFGVTSDSAWALSFPGRSPASQWQAREGLIHSHLLESLPVHPTQIYESASAFAIAAFCILYVQARKRYDGQVFVVFLAAYAIARFSLEFWRSDDRGGILGLSTSQIIAIFMVGGAWALHRYCSRRAAGLQPGA